MPCYDMENNCLPTGCCNSCKAKIRRECKNMEIPNYASIFGNESLIWSREREKKQESCDCLLCKVAVSSGGGYKKLKLEILGKGKKKSKNEARSCPKCFTLLYQGCRHWCTKTQKTENLDVMTDEGDKDKIMHKQIKKKMTRPKVMLMDFMK